MSRLNNDKFLNLNESVRRQLESVHKMNEQNTFTGCQDTDPWDHPKGSQWSDCDGNEWSREVTPDNEYGVPTLKKRWYDVPGSPGMRRWQREYIPPGFITSDGVSESYLTEQNENAFGPRRRGPTTPPNLTPSNPRPVPKEETPYPDPNQDPPPHHCPHCVHGTGWDSNGDGVINCWITTDPDTGAVGFWCQTPWPPTPGKQRPTFPSGHPLAKGNNI